MPILDDVLPKRSYSDAPKGSNKVKLPNGTYAAVLIDVRIYNVTVSKDGDRYFRRFTKDDSPDKNIAVKFQLTKRPDIILQREWPLFTGKNAGFAKFVESLTGIRAGSPELRQFDTDELVGTECLITTAYNDEKGYTNIANVILQPTEDDDLSGVPAHQPEAPKPTLDVAKVKARLKELLNSNRLTPGDKVRALKRVTGSEELRSITSPEVAARVVAELEAELQAADDEIPF